MRDIVKLLLGDDAGRLLSLFSGGGDESGMAERVRRSGEWCGSTPGRDAAARAVRDTAGPHGVRHRVIIREFRGW